MAGETTERTAGHGEAAATPAAPAAAEASPGLREAASPEPAGPPAEPPPPTETPAAESAPPAAAGPATPGEAAAPPRRRRALLVAGLAWLLPGVGHLALGQWLRGPAFTLIVVATAAVGVALDGRLYWFGYGVSPPPIVALAAPENPALVAAASLVSLGLGLPALLLRWLTGYQGDVTAPGFEYGTAFLLTAGLMNLLLVLDAWDAAH